MKKNTKLCIFYVGLFHTPEPESLINKHETVIAIHFMATILLNHAHLYDDKILGFAHARTLATKAQCFQFAYLNNETSFKSVINL